MENAEPSSMQNDGNLSKNLKAKKSVHDSSFSPEKQNNVVRNSLLAGSVAGVISTIACHPFDVLRVKMQSSAPAPMISTFITTTRSVGLVETLHKTIRQGGGLRALYTGLAMPLSAQAIYKGTIFTINNTTESCIREWKKRKNKQGMFEASNKLTLTDRFISGFMGGAVNAALFCTPVEFIRNRQIAGVVDNSKDRPSTAGNSASIQSNYKNNGSIIVMKRTIQGKGFAGLWRGLSSTVLRDSVGCGFYFVAIAYSQEQLTSADSNGPPQTAVVVLSGALAGVSFWLWALPIDTMKTWIQNGTARNLSHVLQISRRNGLVQSIPSLFRGWQVAYARGAPSAAITVLTYSLAFQHLENIS